MEFENPACVKEMTNMRYGWLDVVDDGKKNKKIALNRKGSRLVFCISIPSASTALLSGGWDGQYLLLF